MPDVQMKPEMMQAMVNAFDEAFGFFDDTLSGLKMINGLVDGGALVGKGGAKLADLIQNGIIPFTQTMSDKMSELANDVDAARRFLEEGDETAAGRFH